MCRKVSVIKILALQGAGRFRCQFFWRCNVQEGFGVKNFGAAMRRKVSVLKILALQCAGRFFNMKIERKLSF
jgi:hypothetical protein